MRYACLLLALSAAHTLSAQPGGFGGPGPRPAFRGPVQGQANRGPGQQGAGAQSRSLTGTAVIEGRVLHRRTGEPIPRASLSLRTSDGRQGLMTTADAEGKFRFEEVAAGSYRISAERRGFLRGDFGARRTFQAGSLVTVADGQEVKGVDVKLDPQSVLSGQVLDEYGEPFERAQVELLRFGFVQNRQQLVPVNQASTDDLGQFRIWNLAPGRYYLRARGQFRGMTLRPDIPMETTGKIEENYVPTYFPGVAEFQSATPIEIGVGQDFSGVSLQILKSRVYRIRGRVDGLVPGTDARMNRVMLIQRGAQAFRGFDNTSGVRPNGTFEITNVVPGSYELVLMQGGPNMQRTIRTQVEVANADLNDIVLSPGAAVTVQGAVRAEGETKVNFASLRVMLVSPDPGFIQPNGPVKEDGAFTIENASPDRYRLAIVPLPQGTYVKSIRVSGHDVTRSGLDFSSGAAGRVEVVLGDKPASLEGAVERASTDALPGTVIVLPEPFSPEEFALAPYQGTRLTTSVDQNGRFTIANIPPGEYRVYAFEEFDQLSGYDPERLRKLEKFSEAVKLGEGESKTLALKQIPPEEGQPQ